MSKSKFIHTLSGSKNILALEQKTIVLSYAKNVAFLLGHPVDFKIEDAMNSTVSVNASAQILLILINVCVQILQVTRMVLALS